MYRLVRAVSGEDGCTHVLLHLLAAERTRSAASLVALQRGSAAVPPVVPPAHHLFSTSHTMALSERGEGMSGGVGTVLEEDAVLRV